jgi:hypothetical protein
LIPVLVVQNIRLDVIHVDVAVQIQMLTLVSLVITVPTHSHIRRTDVTICRITARVGQFSGLK